MTIMVPVDKAEELGIRAIVPVDEARRALELIGVSLVLVALALIRRHPGLSNQPSMRPASALIRGSAVRSAVGLCVWKSAPLCADPRSVPSPPFAAALSRLGRLLGLI
jgi:hypothetical protein